MKIVYCTHSVSNPGGMERVLFNKVSWLTAHTDWEVMIVTTDQHGRPPFYPFPTQVRMTDLGVNYSEDNSLGATARILSFLKKRRLHRRRLEAVLAAERPDITVTLYPSESSFIPALKDGSRKILELHYNRFFRLLYARKGLLALADRYRTWRDARIVRKFDRFVVLTEEDRGYWGNLPNMSVIPNAAVLAGDTLADMSVRRVLAVGRFDYQKGFDRLIKTWKIISDRGNAPDWRLDIFGQGEWKGMLEEMIESEGLESSVTLNAPVKDIRAEYTRSSILAMTSHYEGFPMVMAEALACGLPVVSFDCKCGPKDMIANGENGILVRDGDTEAMADALSSLMADEDRRRKMSAEAVRRSERYSEDKVMAMWIDLFSSMKR